MQEKLYDLKLLFKNADKSRGGGQNLQDLEGGGCLDDSGESEVSQRFRVMAVKKNSNAVGITSDILSDKDLEEVCLRLIAVTLLVTLKVTLLFTRMSHISCLMQNLEPSLG